MEGVESVDLKFWEMNSGVYYGSVNVVLIKERRSGRLRKEVNTTGILESVRVMCDEYVGLKNVLVQVCNE